MTVSRKLKSKITPVILQETAPVPVVEEAKTVFKRDTGAPVKKKCAGCKNAPRYWDASTLRRSLSDRGRIYPRTRTGYCAKHQRQLSREIKRARHLALLPFTVKV